MQPSEMEGQPKNESLVDHQCLVQITARFSHDRWYMIHVRLPKEMQKLVLHYHSSFFKIIHEKR